MRKVALGHSLLLIALLLTCSAPSSASAQGGTGGVTVIVHGLQLGLFGTGGPPCWPIEMAQAITTRLGNGTVYVYDSLTGEWLYLSGSGSPTEEIVLVFDWVDQSGAGKINTLDRWFGLHAGAAADVLFAALLDSRFVGVPGGSAGMEDSDACDGLSVLKDANGNFKRTHFIAHSRGATVASECIRRLGNHPGSFGAGPGIPVDQFTALDPHPVNGAGTNNNLDNPDPCNLPITNIPLGSLPSACPTDWADEDPMRWSNNGYLDCYYRADGFGGLLTFCPLPAYGVEVVPILGPLPLTVVTIPISTFPFITFVDYANTPNDFDGMPLLGAYNLDLTNDVFDFANLPDIDRCGVLPDEIEHREVPDWYYTTVVAPDPTQYPPTGSLPNCNEIFIEPFADWFPATIPPLEELGFNLAASTSGTPLRPPPTSPGSFDPTLSPPPIIFNGDLDGTIPAPGFPGDTSSSPMFILDPELGIIDRPTVAGWEWQGGNATSSDSIEFLPCGTLAAEPAIQLNSTSPIIRHNRFWLDPRADSIEFDLRSTAAVPNGTLFVRLLDPFSPGGPSIQWESTVQLSGLTCTWSPVQLPLASAPPRRTYLLELALDPSSSEVHLRDVRIDRNTGITPQSIQVLNCPQSVQAGTPITVDVLVTDGACQPVPQHDVAWYAAGSPGLPQCTFALRCLETTDANGVITVTFTPNQSGNLSLWFEAAPSVETSCTLSVTPQSISCNNLNWVRIPYTGQGCGIRLRVELQNAPAGVTFYADGDTSTPGVNPPNDCDPLNPTATLSFTIPTLQSGSADLEVLLFDNPNCDSPPVCTLFIPALPFNCGSPQILESSFEVTGPSNAKSIACSDSHLYSVRLEGGTFNGGIQVVDLDLWTESILDLTGVPGVGGIPFNQTSDYSIDLGGTPSPSLIFGNTSNDVAVFSLTQPQSFGALGPGGDYGFAGLAASPVGSRVYGAKDVPNSVTQLHMFNNHSDFASSPPAVSAQNVYNDTQPDCIAVSADGNRLAFAYHTTTSPSQAFLEVYDNVSSNNGITATPTTFGSSTSPVLVPDDVQEVAWHPTTNQLAFAPAGEFVRIMNPGLTGIDALLEAPNGDAVELAWNPSPARAGVIAVGYANPNHFVWLYDISGVAPGTAVPPFMQLSDANLVQPVFNDDGQRALSWSPDGETLFVSPGGHAGLGDVAAYMPFDDIPPSLTLDSGIPLYYPVCDSTVEIFGTCSDTVGLPTGILGDAIDVFVNGALASTVDVGSSGGPFSTIVSLPTLGIFDVQLFARDRAGNTTQSATVQVERFPQVSLTASDCSGAALPASVVLPNACFGQSGPQYCIRIENPGSCEAPLDNIQVGPGLILVSPMSQPLLVQPSGSVDVIVEVDTSNCVTVNSSVDVTGQGLGLSVGVDCVVDCPSIELLDGLGNPLPPTATIPQWCESVSNPPPTTTIRVSNPGSCPAQLDDIQVGTPGLNLLLSPGQLPLTLGQGAQVDLIFQVDPAACGLTTVPVTIVGSGLTQTHTIERDVLCIPSLVSPCGSNCEAIPPMLEWDLVPSASSYTVSIADCTSTPAQPPMTFNVPGTINTLQPPGILAATTYCWSVAANGACGATDSSVECVFSTATVLSEPTNLIPCGDPCVPTSVNLDWDDVLGASGYEVSYEGADPCGGVVPPPAVVVVPTSSLFASGLIPGATYTWSVAAQDSCGNSQLTSCTFTVESSPPAPINLSPCGSVCETLEPVLTWDPVCGASSYTVTYGPCNGTMTTVPVPGGTSLQVGPLVEGTSYCWSVVADGPCSSSQASASCMFTTGIPFRRGEIDQVGSINVADAICLLGYLFVSGGCPSFDCLKAGDIDDDDNVAINDAILLLGYLFSGGAPPMQPFPACDLDPTPGSLDCQEFDPGSC